MTSSARISITSLPRGHEFHPSTFSLDRKKVDGYLQATGDTGAYGDAVPPLAIVAFALASLQLQLSLPDGALHTGQETEHEGKAAAGDELTLSGRVAQRSERQGFVISVIELDVSHGARGVLRARTTIMAPGGAS